MTLDLAKIKSDAEKIAANSDLLLMALPVKDVLGMLAEIDRLEMDNRSLKGSCSKLGAEHAGMSRLYKKANRMQFKARQECDQLEAEIEALRKDADRYRWLRSPNRSCHELDSVFDEFGVPLDEKIDSAIAKERP